MRKKHVLIVLILTISILSVSLPSVSPEETTESVSLLVTTPITELTALPGDTLVVPFSVKNTGNTTITNITVYITGPTTGFQYSGKVIRTSLHPGDVYEDTLLLKVLNVEPGQYLLKIIARVGEQYFEAPVIVTVKTLVDYSLAIDVQDRYLYGRPVRVSLSLYSKSNTVISGKIGYYIVGEEGVMLNQSVITYVRPGFSWKKDLEFKTLPLGNYTVVLWANISGLYKETSKSFEVYRRALNYSVRFENGAIRVFVYDPSRRGVPDIAVTINGVELRTGPTGEVAYSISTPGTYRVVLNLDGKIVLEKIVVKSLQISGIQERDRLIVRVTDGKVPVPNVTVEVTGPRGKDLGVTNTTGFVVFNLSRVGYGTLVIRAESSSYLPIETVITTIAPPTQITTTTPEQKHSNTTTTTTKPPLQTTPPESRKPSWISEGTALILILSGIAFAITSYLALAAPIVHEETLDRYYFIKVRAPRLRPLTGYRIERPVRAVEVRATKGNATLNEDGIVWELDLEPGEEAYLQAILG
ncbi:hypothetical protein [Thermococcus stetteri]|uniref:hypothetical protein n=1 Tax=Thermococcus stetteri TaxID=49900 RepID=UPI001AEA9311|nr:hypothetical protein [Thermococcus stetteri]MBP1912311.1 hypothetical protein [Thermococcus stetteri]